MSNVVSSSRLRKFCSLPQVFVFFLINEYWVGEKVLIFTVVLVTDVLLQLDHVSGTTYLPVCETRKSAAQNSEDTENIHVSYGLRRVVTF